jgi:hypothetical protein
MDELDKMKKMKQQFVEETHNVVNTMGDDLAKGLDKMQDCVDRMKKKLAESMRAEGKKRSKKVAKPAAKRPSKKKPAAKRSSKKKSKFPFF